MRDKIHRLLRWSEKYAKTDMVHFMSSNFWLTAGRVIAVGSGMILTIAFANLLDPVAFGTYKYILAAAGLAGAFSLGGINSAVLRVASQKRLSAVPALVRALMLSTIPANLVALGIALYYFLHGNATLGWGFAFIAAFNAFIIGFGMAKAVFIGLGDFKQQLLVSLPRTLVPIATIIITLLITQNIVLILLAYFASNAVGSWSLYRWIMRHHEIVDSPAHVPDAMRFGMHMSVLSFFQLAIGQLDQLLLWHFASPIALAVFALAYSPIQQVLGLTANFSTIAFPKLVNKTEEEVQRMLPLRTFQMFLMLFIIALLYIALVPFVFTVLFPKYVASIFATQVLAIIIVLQVRNLIDAYLTAHGLVKKRYVLVITTQFIDLCVTATLIPLYGLWGAIAATIFVEVVQCFILFFIYMRG